ncbi:MAG: GNAT family N-acetyltransferase [Bacteroidia bacterium]|nr:GNAT family N-acetyltransferase [Bacteroidia bacterium]MDW8301002.1 GNAT family N-acetyltransferase [Bacteroidia bacterium]
MDVINFLSWDSEFFGYKVGQIILHTESIFSEKWIEHARKEGYKLLYIRCVPEHPQEKKIEGMGGILVDEKVTFCQRIPQSPFEYTSSIKLYQEKTPTPQILQLALDSGIYSRFKIDKNFKNNEFQRLYEVWIKNSTEGKIAKHVIIYQKGNETVGLLTLGEKNNRADIGILAVNPQHRREGVGKQLVQKAFELSLQMGHTYIQVVTQKANQNACKFYEKVGFSVDTIEHIYHLWL